MTVLESGLLPLQLDDPRAATVTVHARLRELIYTNALPPGTELSQVKIAKALGVSRTPLREALRRLQEEGLIEAEPNKRCRVVGFNAFDLDAVYGSRLLLEALGMQLTLPLIGAEDLRIAEKALAEMDASLEPGVDPDWHARHHRFHRTFTSRAPKPLISQLASLSERSDGYIRQVARTHHPDGMPLSLKDHYTIFALASSGKNDWAIVQTARHLARTALILLADTASESEPVTIRSALTMIAKAYGEPASMELDV